MESVLSIGRVRWPHLQGMLVSVFMGEILGLTKTEPPGTTDLLSISHSVNCRKTKAHITPIWIAGTQLRRVCIENGFLTEDDFVMLRESRERYLNPLSVLAGDSFHVGCS